MGQYVIDHKELYKAVADTWNTYLLYKNNMFYLFGLIIETPQRMQFEVTQFSKN